MEAKTPMERGAQDLLIYNESITRHSLIPNLMTNHKESASFL